MLELLKEMNKFVHTPCLQMRHWNLNEAALFAQASSIRGKMSVAEGPGITPQVNGLEQALKKLSSLTEKQICFQVNCLTWDGSSDQLGFPCPSSSPSEVVCSDQATGLELMEERYWQGCPPGAAQLAALRCVSAAGHALLPALDTEAEEMEQQD